MGTSFSFSSVTYKTIGTHSKTFNHPKEREGVRKGGELQTITGSSPTIQQHIFPRNEGKLQALFFSQNLHISMQIKNNNSSLQLPKQQIAILHKIRTCLESINLSGLRRLIFGTLSTTVAAPQPDASLISPTFKNIQV